MTSLIVSIQLLVPIQLRAIKVVAMVLVLLPELDYF